MKIDAMRAAMANVAATKRCSLIDRATYAGDQSSRLERQMLRYESWRERTFYERGAPFVLEITMTNGTEMNALAARSSEGYFILMFEGVAVTVERLTALLMSDPDFLSGIPDANGEDAERCLLLPGVDPLSQLMQGSALTPLTESRKAAAQLLADVVVDFLFLHELGHICDGHVGLIPAASGLQVIAEAGAPVANALRPIDYQTLEMDADCFAATIMLRVLNKMHVPPCLVDQSLEASTWYNATMMSALLQIVHIAFKFYEVDFAMADFEAGYPPTQIRSNLLKSTMASCCRDQLGRDNNISYELFEQSIIKAEQIFAKVFGGNFDLKNYVHNVQNVYGNHGNRVLKNWQRVRPLVERHALLGALAPVNQKL